jgi:general secretion pathway protein D
VRLEVDEQTEEIASIDKVLGPTTSKRTAKTTVVAKDQETVVLGGLIQDRTVKSVSKVPILGSIPILGFLFRNEQVRKTKTNLLLFLTPYIIRDPSDYRRIFERKMAERAEFVKRFSGQDTRYEPTIDYAKKPGMLQRVKRAIDVEMSRPENGGLGSPDDRVIYPRPPPAAPAPAPAPEKNRAPTPRRGNTASEKAPAGERAPGAQPPAEQPTGREPGTQLPSAEPQTEPALPPAQAPPAEPGPDSGPPR